MADTGILYRRDSKANLILNPPIIGEVVFATDTEEYGALHGVDIVWRPHTDDAKLNAHKNASDIHFTQSQISITQSQISDLNALSITRSQISDLSGLTITQSQISDLDNFLTSETSHADVLVDADIGVNVQAYDVNTVSDASYVHTDLNFTNILKTSYDVAAIHANSTHAPINADNTAQNETSHADVLVDADVLGTISSTNKLITQNDVSSFGTGDMTKVVYDSNNNGRVDDSDLVNGLNVETAVPLGAIFTDTIIDDANLINYNNSNSSLVATNVQGAIDELKSSAFDTNSPTFTGTPIAPTASIGTNTNQIATTAFVLANSSTGSGDALSESDFDGSVGDDTFIIVNKVITKIFLYIEGIKVRSSEFTLSNDGTNTTIQLNTALSSNAWISAEYQG